MSVNLPPGLPRPITSFSRSQSWAEPLRATSHQSNTSTTSFGTVHRPHNRRLSATSFKSASSTPAESSFLNNENQDPARASLRLDEKPDELAVPKPLQRRKSKASSHKSSWGNDIPVPPRSRASSLIHESGPLENVALGPSSGLESTDNNNSGVVGASKGIDWVDVRYSKDEKRKSEDLEEGEDEAPIPVETCAADGEHPFRRWMKTLRRRNATRPGPSTFHVTDWPSNDLDKRRSDVLERQLDEELTKLQPLNDQERHPTRDVEKRPFENLEKRPSNDSDKASAKHGFLTVPALHDRHSKRSSLASSGFYTGLRTATASLESSSVLPRSRRTTMLSDPRTANRSSYLSNSDARESDESGRPPTVSSMDDAAWTRGVKRRHIIQEIVTSEESYVADLKVLVNVYFTLLASTPALSDRTRSSIRHNVMEILHIHEDLVKKLHSVIVSSEVRPHEEEPKKRHVRWRSLDPTSSRRRQDNSHQKRRSIGNPGSWMRDNFALTAEPSEAADVARVFKDMLGRFFAYEEYCAKYELMVKDVASTYKCVPGWHAYEIGLEALANSLASLNTREGESKKALMFADLLMKPIQRVCKYPLFFADLLKHTPVVDCPEAHAEIDRALSCLRETVREVNKAKADDQAIRGRIQRTWLLQDRLIFPNNTGRAGICRTLGHVLLCGVLHVAYQTRHNVHGEYMLCALFKSYMLLATPSEDQQQFHVVIFIHVLDVKIETTEDGKGLQCHTAPYSWKLVFESDNRLFELVLNACSAKEEDAWKSHFLAQANAESLMERVNEPAARELYSTTSLDLTPAGQIFGQPGTLARRLSVQRAATVGTKSNICQIIIRNTHVPKDSNEHRYPFSPSLNRSQSLLTTHRIPILAPKRSDRIRLEQVLQDVWTKDIIPYPGMVIARGDQFKASANSVMRKLSLVGMSGAFARRSTSLTALSPCKSNDEEGSGTQTEESALGLSQDRTHSPVISEKGKSKMTEQDAESERLLREDQPSPLSINGLQRIRRAHNRKFRKVSKPLNDSPASSIEKKSTEEETKTKKRWSNPFGVVKSISTDGIRVLFG